jgi:hypothetical protein
MYTSGAVVIPCVTVRRMKKKKREAGCKREAGFSNLSRSADALHFSIPDKKNRYAKQSGLGPNQKRREATL